MLGTQFPGTASMPCPIIFVTLFYPITLQDSLSYHLIFQPENVISADNQLLL